MSICGLEVCPGQGAHIAFVLVRGCPYGMEYSGIVGGLDIGGHDLSVGHSMMWR